MRTRYTFFILTMALLGLASCKKEEITITYFKQLQSLSDDASQKELLNKYPGWIEYDSVRFSDDSYAVHRLQFAPQNSLTEFFDSQGRTIATVARASECYAQTLVYDYNDQGRLIHLLEYKKEIFEGLESDSTSYGRTKDGYLGFRKMIAHIDYEHPDTAQYQQTNIEYDEAGNAVKVYVVYGAGSIAAPKGYKLDVSVKPCPRFWQSDLDGGHFIFQVKKSPTPHKIR